MTLKITLLFSFLAIATLHYGQSISINNTGDAPDASAMLDVQSLSKGMLVPRMSKSKRQDIVNPATGLIVYDTDFNSFWFWAGSSWVEVMDGFTPVIRDTDNDTRVHVEKTADADEVEFTVAGAAVAKLNNKTLAISSNGNSSNPQLSVQETQTSDFSRINMINSGISERWTLSARNSLDSSTTRFNIFNSNYGGDVMAVFGNGRIGIGTTSPDSRVNVRSSIGENPMRLRIGGATKFLAHNNGGTSIGVNTTPPENGLYVQGDIKFNGKEIYASDTLRLRTNTRIELIAGSSKIILDPATGIKIESSTKIDLDATDEMTMDVQALAVTSNDLLELNSSTDDVLINAMRSITNNPGDDFIVDADNVSITSQNTMTFTSDGNILIDGGDRIDIDAMGNMELTSSDFDVLASNDMTLDADFDIDILPGSDLNITAGVGIDINGGTTFDVDVGNVISLDGVFTKIQAGPSSGIPALHVSSLTNTPCPIAQGSCSETLPTSPSSTVFIGG